jgi:hypothetical protein
VDRRHAPVPDPVDFGHRQVDRFAQAQHALGDRGIEVEGAGARSRVLEPPDLTVLVGPESRDRRAPAVGESRPAPVVAPAEGDAAAIQSLEPSRRHSRPTRTNAGRKTRSRVARDERRPPM